MLYTSLNFKIHMPDFDPASCRLDQQCYSFVIILLFSYFYTAGELFSNYKRGRFR